MGRLGKVVIVVLLLAGVAYGGLRAWVYYKYKDGVDQFVTQVSPFVAIKYGSITSSLDGSVGLADLTITPRNFGESFHVEAVELHLPSVWYVLKGSDAFQRGKLPVNSGVSVRGLRLDLDGRAAALFDRFAQAQAARRGGGTVGCGSARYIGPRQLQAMGYDNLTLDVDAGYRFVAGEQGMRVNVRVNARDMWQTEIHAVFQGPTQSVASLLPGSRKLLQSMTIAYRDESYAGRLVKYCAGLSGRSPAATIEAMAGPHPDRGVMPGPGLVAARKAMLAHPGTARIEIHPATPIALDSLSLYQPQDVVRMLNLKLTVNGKPIKGALVAAGTAPAPARSARSTRAAPPFVARVAPSSPPPAATTRRPPPRVVARWRVVDLQRLGSMVGRQVRVHTHDGRVRAGVLEAMKGEALMVKQSLYGGTMTVPVARADIERVEVLVVGGS